ncbi:UNVERIFIED_CONTAM: Inositol oxygenase 1 [Sesamum latifolium]|uniref:inositol oxygenase n=1 Tax=Sesamum latifolium TaxID=2727402 RepID=A0AAW2U250_9LAMI
MYSAYAIHFTFIIFTSCFTLLDPFFDGSDDEGDDLFHQLVAEEQAPREEEEEIREIAIVEVGSFAPQNNAFGNSFRNYQQESLRRIIVEEFYRENHTFQTYDFAMAKKEEYGRLNKGVMSIWECCELLNEYVDESDPDLDEPQLEHLLQTAKLSHSIGFISLHSFMFFGANPDSRNPDYNTKLGIYIDNCGLENVTMSWGHDEYMYLKVLYSKSKVRINQEEVRPYYLSLIEKFFNWEQFLSSKHEIVSPLPANGLLSPKRQTAFSFLLRNRRRSGRVKPILLAVIAWNIGTISSSGRNRANCDAQSTALERGMHSRNKKAMQFIAKGYSALQEVDRVIDYCELNDKRLIPLLRAAKEQFELALEADNSNTHARYWLSKLHLKYHVPGANKAVCVVLVEAAEMGDPDAQYELGCRLRVENDYVQSDQQAFYYLEKAVDQLHPGALYLLGAVYLTGDCVKQDVSSALWCFHRASEKGHAGAAIAYGSLLLRGVQLPETLTKFNVKKGFSNRKSRKDAASPESNPVELARQQFEIAANAGCDLGLKWLQRLEKEEKNLLSS